MTEPDPSRRRFLARIVVALNAAIATLVATPAVGYILSPLLGRRSSQWVVLDTVSRFTDRLPRRVLYAYRDDRGYVAEKRRRAAFVIREGDALVVLSPVCTHMGCNVGFNEETRRFECPCHGGKYDAAGRVVGGPPQHPLQRFKTRVRNANLEIYVT